MKPSLYIVALFAIGMVMSCSKSAHESITDLPDSLSTNRDTTVRPGDDFFYYANGGWFKRNPIPATDPYNGTWKLIGDTIQVQVRHVCERSAADSKAEKGSAKQKIGDFFAAGMDTLQVEQQGIAPLKDGMALIDAIHDVPSLNRAIVQLRKMGVDAAYSLYVGQDDKISNKYAVQLWQGGLGMDDRDYYFKNDAQTVHIRKEYMKHLETMLGLLGEEKTKAAQSAATVMKLETDLAKASRKLEALRDPFKNYNKMTVAGLEKVTPDIPWADVLSATGLSKADSVIVGQPEFYTALNKLFRSYPLENWKTYLRWQLFHEYARYLSKTVVDENFRFYSTVMYGTTQQRPRWKRVVAATDSYLGDLIGQVYVAEYLPKGSKEKLLEIAKNIQVVFADHIQKLNWMSAATKEKALAKLNKIVMKVGYPDKWKDLSQLEVSRNSYCGNAMKANAWRFQYMINKFGKPVDRLEWGMQPHTYNAYYNPSNNEICLPACNVIVPGYEGRLPDDAILYGIVGGSTIGHEITHGFDDQGSLYDGNGNLHDWWTPEDRKKFVAKTKQIVKQFDNYVLFDSLHLNGDATQGENIADLGGVIMGLEAFRKTEQYKANQLIKGLTPDQRYFLGYAYSWMVNYRKEALAASVMTDVHSPAQYRVIGPLSNIPEFYSAFGVKEGDKMYREDSVRVVIW